jgi:O-antigen/teichoic acid export membrane protein
VSEVLEVPPANGDEPRGARRLVRTFVSLAGAELLTRASLFAAALIVVRALSPGSFGEFSYALALASIVNFVIDFGVTPLVTRDISAEPGRAGPLLGAFLRTQVLMASGTFALATALAYAGAFGGPASFAALALALGAISVSSLSRPFEATVTGRGRAQIVTFGRIVRGVALIGATVIAALIDKTPESFLTALLASEVIGVLAVGALTLARSTRPVFAGGLADLRRLLRLSIPFAVLAGFSVLYLRVDILMLGQLESAADVGNYGIASRIMDTAIVVPAYFGSAFLATIAQTGPRTARGHMQTAGALRHILVICVPLAFALGVCADPLVNLVAGSDYDSAGTLLAILSPWLALIASYSVLSNLQVALDRVRVLIAIVLAGLVLKIAANGVLIPLYGPEGAAVAAVIAEAAVVVAQWWSARDYIRFREMSGYFARLLVSTGAMIATTLPLIGPLGWPLALALGFVVFGALAVALGCVSREELRVATASLRARAT